MKKFAFSGAEHQWTLFLGLAIIFAGIGLVPFGIAQWWWLPITWLVTMIYVMVASVGFHRLFCHNSYKTYRPIEFILLWIGTLGCYGSSLHFTLSHIWHHRYSDTDKDPQQFKTFLDVFRPSYIEMEASMSDLKMLRRRLSHKPEHKFFHKYYWGVVLFSGLTLFAFGGWQAALYLWAMPAALAVFTGRIFNWWAHEGMKGPRNVPMWGALMGSGEHLHDNHHGSPASWDYRETTNEIDPGAFIVWLIMKNRPSWKSFISLDHKLEKRQI